MSKDQSKENAQTPPPRDLVREARRLARLRRLRLVADQAHVDHVSTGNDPKEAA